MPADVNAILDLLQPGLAIGQDALFLVGLALFPGPGIWDKLRGRRPAREDADSRLNPESRRVLQAAVNRRAALDIFLGEKDPTSFQLAALDRDTVQVTAPITLPISPDVAGKEVDCFFRIPSHAPGEEWDFYRFRGRIQGLLRGEDKELILAIALPERVETGQKRQFFRLKPPRGLVLRVAVWPGKEARTPVRDLPKPGLRYQVDKPASFRLADISAGGLLLEGLNSGVQDCGLPLEPGSEWFFLVSVQDPGRNDRHDWWLTAALVNRQAGAPGRQRLAFKLTGFASSLKVDAPDWEAVPDDGVQVMAAWIFQRTLELTRLARETD
ncbi:MAG: hypothetical protein AB1916_01785 [Thermodesulfobacteriota bacterium]